MRGGNRNQDWSGHRKKSPLTFRGKVMEGDALGSMALEMGGHKKTRLVGSRKVSVLERAKRDRSGWRKKGTWRGGDRDWSGQNKIKKQVRGTHSPMSNCLGHRKKGGAVCNWSVHGESEQVWHSPIECLGQCGTRKGSSDGSCEGETQVVSTLGESKQVTHLPA